jgi:hypothetical protein
MFVLALRSIENYLALLLRVNAWPTLPVAEFQSDWHRTKGSESANLSSEKN